MASLLTNASDIHDGNVQDAVAQITGNTSAAAAAQKEADDAYYRAPREDPNEEIVLGFYNNFIKLKNKWSNKRNRDDDFVEEISDAVYKYEEWKNSVRPDGDSNFGNPKYDRRYKRWNTKFANFLKKVRPRNYNSYSPEEKVEYRDLKGKKPKSFYTVLNNLVTKLDQESQQWYPSDSDSSSGGGRRRKKRGGDQGNAPVTFIVSNDNIAITQFNENIKARQDIDLTFIKGNSKDGRDAIVYEMRNSGLIGGWFIIKYDPNSENNAQFGHWKRNAFVDDEYPEQANEIIAEDNIKIGDRFVIQTPDQIGGKRRRRKTRKMKKSRKKRGGRKLNLFLSEINNRLRDVEERGEEREDEIRSNSAEIRNNDAAIIGNGDEITENAVDIGVIRSYINYKLNNTIENAAAPLDQWQGHLRSIDRRSHQELEDTSLLDRQILTNANMSGGMKKTRKMKGGHHLYKRLGVSKYATQKQIKKAYNKFKKKKKLTKKVKYAYKILSKKKSRKKYNAKYKKMKKSKKKRRRRGGIASIVIKGKMHPGNYEPGFDIPDQNASQPAWLGNL